MHLVTRLAAALFSGAWYRAAQTLPLMLVYRQAVRAAQTVTLVYMQAGATCGTKIACHVELQAGSRATEVSAVTLVSELQYVQPKHPSSCWFPSWRCV